jgi:hypothetical protein
MRRNHFQPAPHAPPVSREPGAVELTKSGNHMEIVPSQRRPRHLSPREPGAPGRRSARGVRRPSSPPRSQGATPASRRPWTAPSPSARATSLSRSTLRLWSVAAAPASRASPTGCRLALPPPPPPRTIRHGPPQCRIGSHWRNHWRLIGRLPAPGGARVWSHCRFARPPIHVIPDSLRGSVPLFLERRCDRTPGGAPGADRRPRPRRRRRPSAAQGAVGVAVKVISTPPCTFYIGNC